MSKFVLTSKFGNEVEVLASNLEHAAEITGWDIDQIDQWVAYPFKGMILSRTEAEPSRCGAV